jgi:hypothetical protein
MLNELAANTNFIVFGLIRTGIEPTIYCILDERANQQSMVRHVTLL